MKVIKVEYYPDSGFTRVWVTKPSLPGMGWLIHYFSCEAHAQAYAAEHGAEFTVEN